MGPTPTNASMKRQLLVYTVVVLLSILIVAGLIQIGTLTLSPQAGIEASRAVSATTPWAQMIGNAESPLPRLILQLIVILVAARVLGALAGRFGQPQVIGEIAAGVLLGPSLLGWVAPDASAYLFPTSSLPTLQLLSQIGVLLFMFIVGVELEASHLRGKARAAVAVSHFSIVIPFILGVSLSLALYTHHAPAGVPFHSFALFLGIAMSITAFPVLARMLEERGLTTTPLGTTAITCAAVDDVTAWSLLAFVVAVTTSSGALAKLVVMIALSLAFVATMFFVVRPLLRHMFDPEKSGDALSKERIAIVLTVLLGSALATEIIGIHALFGAFVAGAIMPTGGVFRRVLRERLESVSSVFLLPLFFAYTGLRTQIGLLDSFSSWATCLTIILVATGGKLGGTALAARWTGMSWRDAMALGALMNTRGLMELIALNVGYDLGILSPRVFAMMVLMALVTTAMTGPLLSLTFRWGRPRVTQSSFSTTIAR
jgi:Kef-type K+ transport system membrane component KefB